MTPTLTPAALDRLEAAISAALARVSQLEADLATARRQLDHAEGANMRLEAENDRLTKGTP